MNRKELTREILGFLRTTFSHPSFLWPMPQNRREWVVFAFVNSPSINSSTLESITRQGGRSKVLNRLYHSCIEWYSSEEGRYEWEIYEILTKFISSPMEELFPEIAEFLQTAAFSKYRFYKKTPDDTVLSVYLEYFQKKEQALMRATEFRIVDIKKNSAIVVNALNERLYLAIGGVGEYSIIPLNQPYRKYFSIPIEELEELA